MTRRVIYLFSTIVASTLIPRATLANAQNITSSLDEYLAISQSVYVCNTHPRYREKDKTRLVLHPEVAKYIISKGGYLGPCATYGDKRSMGAGYFQTYVQLRPDGAPWAIGFEFPSSTLTNLPTEQYDGQNCYDINGNGVLDLYGVITDDLMHHDECGGGHQRLLDFPLTAQIAPFKWGLINWQAKGHSPAPIFDQPHFDFHFYTQDVLDRNFIRVGPCALLINCDDMIKAQKPIPAGYIHPDYIDVGAAESRMGNHLIDPTSPEWNGLPFTETWLFGAYDGKLTFWEPMITKAYLESQPFMCKDIKLPLAYQEAGYYPTQYCIRYRKERNEFTVSIEGFVYREAR